MLTFDYQTAWVAAYTGDNRELAWLKRVFTYTDMTDTRHKARMGYFPSYCTIDDVNRRASHGQVIHAVRQARKDGIQIQINDPNKRYRLETGSIDPNYLPGITAYDYQLLSAQIALGSGHGLVNIATGGGKCLGLGTKVLMYDGTTKIVEEVVTGDLLMGPDSLPKTVRSTCRGRGELFRITPTKGESWVCNDVHVLTLKHTTSGEIIDIPLDEYQKTNKNFKHLHKQFSVGIEHFPNEADVLPIDPYFLGIWLGDGTKKLNGVAITKEDREIVCEIEKQALTWGLRVRTDDSGGTRCKTHHLVSDEWKGQHRDNKLLNTLRSIFQRDLSIPLLYLAATKANRLELLAGLLDTDGHLHNNFFEITQKRREIADGITFLARSVGCKVTERVKFVNGNPYVRIFISGELSQIPTRIPRKQAKPRRQIKDACRTGFTVSPIGEGEYAGFELDGDGRFLLGDFTVTHNTVVMGMCMKALATMTDCPGILVLIFSKDLLDQTARRMIAYGIPADDIGIIHSEISANQQRAAAEKRVVLSTHLSIQKYDGVIDRTRIVICDEAHRAVGNLWSALFGRLPNLVNVLGFTATPWDNEGERMKMIAIFGQELVNIPCKFLIDRGVLMRPKSYFIKIYYKDRDIKLCNALDWREAKKQFILEDRNRNLLPVVALRKFGGRMLVIYDDLEHGEHLKELYEEQGYETRLAEGKTSTKNRASAIEWFEKDCEPGQQGKVLLASKVFDEGIDIKGGCDLFFPIGAGKDRSKVIQRLGRALRKNRTGILRIFDTQDSNNPILSRWSATRRGALEECGVQPEVISLEEFVKLT